MSIFVAGLLAVACAASLVCTEFVRRYAERRRMLDIPSGRSSHLVPRPRGGGLAIVVVFCAGAIVLWLWHLVPGRILLALIPPGLGIAAVGWLDDKRGLSPLARIAVHACSAGWAVCCLGGLARISYGPGRITLGAPASILALLGIIWCTNLYNFMDGLDGLAGSETVIVGAAGGLLALRLGLTEIALLSWLVAAAGLGFLVWNWPPARVFMGDVGSGFLGFVFGALAMAGEKTGRMPLLLWVLLLGVFIVDATATLIRRIIRGEKWFDAHHTHAYQVAAQLGYSHRDITVAIVAIDLMLSCCAFLVSICPIYAMPIVLGSLAVLLLVYLKIMALGGLMRRRASKQPVVSGSSSTTARGR